MKKVASGLIPKEIATSLDVPPSLVSYYISRAKERGFVKEEFRDTFKSYGLTQAGKNFLDQYDISKPSPWPLCRGENIQFKADIVQMPTIPVNWRKIEMHNWVQYESQIDTVKVKLNNGKTPTLTFHPSPVERQDPFDIYIIMLVDVVNVILELERKIGLRVERLRLGARGEWLIYDPVARFFCKTNGQVTYEGVTKVNASKPRRIGEFEFFDPRALLAYISMPSLVERIDKRTGKIESMVENLVREKESRATPPQISYQLQSSCTSIYGTFVPLLVF